MTTEFITKLDIASDLEKMIESFNTILEKAEWGKFNQIGLNYRPGAEDPWHDAAGSLYDKETKKYIDTDLNFTMWNVFPQFLSDELQKLYSMEQFKPGRVRFMRLLPKTGLSIHSDYEVRYHYVIKTNPHSIFGNYSEVDSTTVQACGEIFNIPANGHWYKVNTRLPHFVYNGGFTERIHLVICRY